MSDSAYLMKQEKDRCGMCDGGTMEHQELREAIQIIIDADKDGLIQDKNHLLDIVRNLRYSDSPCLWCDGTGILK